VSENALPAADGSQLDSGNGGIGLVGKEDFQRPVGF
jgi:hypothetical protein